jgi:Tat protein translocase TatB subunit
MGIQELAVIFILALVFIGPKQLPELAKTLGKVFRDFKRASNEITDSLQREAKQFTEIQNDIKKDINNVNIETLPEGSAVQQEARLGSAIEMERMEAEEKRIAEETLEAERNATQTASDVASTPSEPKKDDDKTKV